MAGNHMPEHSTVMTYVSVTSHETTLCIALMIPALNDLEMKAVNAFVKPLVEETHGPCWVLSPAKILIMIRSWDSNEYFFNIFHCINYVLCIFNDTVILLQRLIVSLDMVTSANDENKE